MLLEVRKQLTMVPAPSLRLAAMRDRMTVSVAPGIDPVNERVRISESRILDQSGLGWAMFDVDASVREPMRRYTAAIAAAP
ncbi:hypothetical protein [Paraburkholderia sp.]|uniref:hypothetical protein n=1 Tax=Paraburkholderia sp. TaxID=1926495 RepID=UPI00238BC992|nr:hypothetical protein [Paraburkholderia sp.]MDE1181065.1 hypothetical protein [Paraburkholderia sp.]